MWKISAVPLELHQIKSLCLLYWTRYLFVSKGLLSLTLSSNSDYGLSYGAASQSLVRISGGKTLVILGALTLVLWLRDDLSNHCRSPCNPSCLNNLIPKTLSWMMARQLGHLTGIHVSLISHLFALISSGSSWSSSCWSVYRPQPNTRWLAHSSSMSVYAGNQSMHVRTEPHGDKGLGSRETKARARGSRRCMRRSSRVWGFMMKTATPQAWWEEDEEEEWTSVSSLISVNPLPARSQGSHPTHQH